MYQITPLEKFKNNKNIIDNSKMIKMKDIVYSNLLKLSKMKVNYKIIKDNDLEQIDNHPIIFTANHSRFQDTPIVCNVIKDTLHERGYILTGKQKLGFVDEIFFNLYGSIFVDRKNKEDMAKAKEAMEKYLEIGKNLIVFPEGTWNLSDELLMLPMKWGIIDVAKKTNSQIIPVVLDYDKENMECHVKFGSSRLISKSADNSDEIDKLRSDMSELRLEYIRNNSRACRESINISKERENLKLAVKEYPKFDYDYEQSIIFKPNTTPEEVFAPIKKLKYKKETSFLFDKKNHGIR